MLTGIPGELDDLDAHRQNSRRLAKYLDISFNSLTSKYACEDPSITIDKFLESLSELKVILSKSYRDTSVYNATVDPFIRRAMSGVLPKLQQNTAGSTVVSCYTHAQSDLKDLAKQIRAVTTRDESSDLFEALDEVLVSAVDTGVSLQALKAAVQWHKEDEGKSKDAIIKEFEDNLRHPGTTGTFKLEDPAAV